MSYVDPIQQKNLIRAAVKEATDPLVEQIARLEAKIDALTGKTPTPKKDK